MKIQPINNNVSHKAYFKNDSAGLFKKYWSSPVVMSPKLINLANDFRTKCPDHALEIMDVKMGYGFTKICEILNTYTGQKIKISATEAESFVEKMLTTLVRKHEEKNIFFNEDSESAKFFRIITGQD